LISLKSSKCMIKLQTPKSSSVWLFHIKHQRTELQAQMHFQNMLWEKTSESN
jgi:hypothetical protein